MVIREDFAKNITKDLMKYPNVLLLSPHYSIMQINQTDMEPKKMKSLSSIFTITITTPLG
ncbi:hypothetical protein D2V93_07825 [Flagellimonas taeanensis]|nr:hypothetical protein D2V93_07825 [Allomuricauda taeanensis]